MTRSEKTIVKWYLIVICSMVAADLTYQVTANDCALKTQTFCEYVHD